MISNNMSLIASDRLTAIETLARVKAPKEGIGAEVGVYKGGSLKIIADALAPRKVYGFDTFTGLPKSKLSKGELHAPGEFSDTSLRGVSNYLKDCSNVELILGVFPDLVDENSAIDKAKYAFVHIDVDYYLSVKESLNFFWPRMVPGGIIVFDDYEWDNCPGVKQALDEFSEVVPIYSMANYQVFLVKPE
jgi:O-methyltransferase